MDLTRLLSARRVLKPLLHLAVAAPLLLLASRVLWNPSALGANPVAFMTDTLGVWALRLLMATLALTPLRILTSVSAWLHYRRLLGLWSALYASLHLLLYVGVDQQFDWPILIEDVLKRPWITLGALGVLILWLLAITSLPALRRVLGSRWQTLHYSVYAAAILGVWHYAWQVKKDLREPLVYGAVLLTLFLARVFKRRLRGRFAPATTRGKI